MKRILLTTTALTMTAGIAAAEVSISGDFRLGFNDTVSDMSAVVGVVGDANYAAAANTDNKVGIYNDAGIAIAMSSTLDNGMTAGVTVDLDGNDFAAQATDKYTFSLSNDTTSVTFGTTEYSAITNWTSAGAMATDTWANQNADNMNVLRAETTVGGLKVSVSSNMIQDTTAAAAGQALAKAGSTDPLSITIGGSLGGASYVIANEGSKMGIAATTAVGGATVTTAYSTAPTRTTSTAAAVAVDVAGGMDTSTGVKIAYPMGAIVATASYVMEGAGTCVVVAPATACATNADTWDLSAKWTSGDTSVTFSTDEGSDNKIEGSTKLGGATLAAGLTAKLKDMYLSVTNPLGGGASIMASYAIDGDGASAADEVGGPDLQEGLTVELKFAF
jgi:hypothetical protein